MATVRSSSRGVAIRYMYFRRLLWLTSCFHTVVSTVRHVHVRERNSYDIDYNQISLDDNDQRVLHVAGCAAGAKSAIYDFPVVESWTDGGLRFSVNPNVASVAQLAGDLYFIDVWR